MGYLLKLIRTLKNILSEFAYCFFFINCLINRKTIIKSRDYFLHFQKLVDDTNTIITFIQCIFTSLCPTKEYALRKAKIDMARDEWLIALYADHQATKLNVRFRWRMLPADKAFAVLLVMKRTTIANRTQDPVNSKCITT